MFKSIKDNFVPFLVAGAVIGLLVFPLWSHYNQKIEIDSTNSRVDTLQDGLRINGGPLVGASTLFAQNASVQGNLAFYGEIKPDGLSCSNGEILKKTGSNDWDCAADADSGTAGAADSDIPFVTIGNTSSLSFERALTGTANQITVTDGGANGNVTLSIPSLLVGTGASFSYGEFTVQASASAFLGTAFDSVGDCNDATEAIGWSAGLFNCRSVQDLDGTLTALAALDTSAGYVVMTGADTFAKRTLTGTSNQISITNGDGTIGNPVFSIPSLLDITSASLSSNFEAKGYASASFFQGSAFGGIDCNDDTDKLMWSSGLFTCGTLADADIPDALTIDTGSTLNTLSIGSGVTWTTTGTLTIGDGGDAVNFNTSTWDVSSGIFSGVLGMTGTGVYDFGGADSFELPQNGTINAIGEVTFFTASTSIDWYTGSRIAVVKDERCFTYYYGTPTTSKDTQFGKRFNDPFTITEITSISSGSNSVGWNLFTETEGNNIFSSNKSASSAFTYTSFNDSTIIDGDRLLVRISSSSAVNDDLVIDICGHDNH